jgi:hypothetical protein
LTYQKLEAHPLEGAMHKIKRTMMKEYTVNTSKLIDENGLYDFYTYAVLPQFGIASTPIAWQGVEQLGPDEFLCRFHIDNECYALVYEDYDGLGRSDAFIREKVVHKGQDYRFVQPVSQSNTSPSYDGFKLQTPSQYVEGITGTFTLIKVGSMS